MDWLVQIYCRSCSFSSHSPHQQNAKGLDRPIIQEIFTYTLFHSYRFLCRLSLTLFMHLFENTLERILCQGYKFVDCFILVIMTTTSNVLFTFMISVLLTLTNLLNFLNGIIHLTFLELSIVIFRDINMRTCSWSSNSIEPGQTALMCMLAWFYTDSKD